LLRPVCDGICCVDEVGALDELSRAWPEGVMALRNRRRA
jgi:hypothetical protein